MVQWQQDKLAEHPASSASCPWTLTEKCWLSVYPGSIDQQPVWQAKPGKRCVCSTANLSTCIWANSILQLMSDIRRDNKCQQHAVRTTWIPFVNVWWAVHREAINCLRNHLSSINLFLHLFVLKEVGKKKEKHLPDDVRGSRPTWNADPGADSQSREETRRRSRRLGVEDDRTAMTLDKETEGGNKRGTETLWI